MRAGLVVLVVGILLAVPAVVVLVARAARALNAPSMATPGSAERHLAPATWIVFERTGTRSGVAGLNVTQADSPELQPAEVTVTGPDGSTVPVSYVTTNQTMTKSSAVYTGVLQFHVDTGGTYTIDVTGPPLEVIVSRSLPDTFRGLLGVGAAAGLGGLLALAGLVLLVVGAVRGSRPPAYAPASVAASFTPAGAAYTPAGAGFTPAGWYQDPAGQARLRWWDGARWTDHSA